MTDRSSTAAGAVLLIALLSAAILGSALASQYWGGLEPCQLCLYQRAPYVVTIALGLLAALPLPRGLRLSCLLLEAIMGREKVVPCDEPAWTLFGVSMAGYNFLASVVLAGFTLWLAGRVSGR
ncbi:MAG: disulfide bond formation protein B [Limibacillus sp.]